PHAERHVRVLRVGNDERTRRAVGFDLSKFLVEGLHARYFIRARIWSVIACTAFSASASNPALGVSFAGTAQVTPGRHWSLSQSSHSFKPWRGSGMPRLCLILSKS